MSIHRNLMTVCFAAVFALGLAACSSSSDDDPPEVAMPEPMPEPEPPAPTDLETTQAAAKAAADAAKMASDDAATAADGAEGATANLATSQTNAMAQMHADAASEYAKMAMAEYMKAKAASDAAAAATMASAAGAELAKASAAQAAAEAAAKTAGEKATMATEAAAMELMIDGTMKMVGDSKVDATAGPSSVATGSGDDATTVVTGLIKSMNPMAMGGPIEGKAFVAATLDNPNTGEDESKADTAVKGVAYQQAAAKRTFAIGKTLDSSDDMARLMLITGYAGQKMVKVFADAADTDNFTGLVKDDGSIQHNAGTTGDTSDDHVVTLRSVGMFYEATAVAGATGAVENELDATDSVGEMAKAVEVFHATGPGPLADDASDDISEYVVLQTTSKTGTATTVTYRAVDIMAAAARDGDDDDTALDQVRVTSGIPGAVGYKHLHFGVWAALGKAAADGDQDVTGLGIGFVQSIGDGMTGADMPNQGTATYDGNWVAAVQGENSDGTSSLETGGAMLTADLDKATLKANLAGLAMLEGKLDGSSFKGTKATVGDNTHGLTPGGSFKGDFSGGFYGPKAAEAGGIFDFASDSSGAFRGAFGGHRTDVD